MKKLIPALCMLLIAAALMGTSTYAWFSINKEVSATGMKVMATVEDSIFIKAVKEGSKFGVSADLSNPGNVATKLSPVSSANPTIDVENWFTGTAESATNYAIADGDQYEAVSTNLTGYVATYQLAMYSTATNSPSAYLKSVSITRNGGNNSLSPALRVALYADPTNIYYLTGAADGADSAATRYVKSANETDVTSGTLITPETLISQVAFDLSGKTEAAPLILNVLVWYEGQDAACTTDNFSTADLTIGLNFTSITASTAITVTRPGA